MRESQEPSRVEAPTSTYDPETDDPWLETVVEPPPNEAETQPVQPTQPEAVPTPIDGVLGNQWQCSGEVDAARLQTQLDAAAADFRTCFVDAMVSQKITKVDVQLIARVNKSGKVTDHVVRSEPQLDDSLACAANVLRGLSMVRPRGGDCFVLDYPLRFKISY